MRIIVNTLAVALPCAVIGVTADLFRKAGFSLYTERYLAGLLALAMPLLYLYVPAIGRIRAACKEDFEKGSGRNPRCKLCPLAGASDLKHWLPFCAT